jgi:hypothetical protein
MTTFTNGVWQGFPEAGGHVTFACPFWNDGLPFTCRVEDVLRPDGGLIEVVDDDGKVIVPVVGDRDGEESSGEEVRQEVGGEEEAVHGIQEGRESL